MKNFFSRQVSTALVFGLAVMSHAASSLAQTPEDPAQAFPSNQWNICNETSYVLRIATAVQEDGRMTPRGWERIRPGACLRISALSKGQPKRTNHNIYRA